MVHIVRKSTWRFTKSSSLVLVRLVLTEIQPFENVKIYNEMYSLFSKSFAYVNDIYEYKGPLWAHPLHSTLGRRLDQI